MRHQTALGAAAISAGLAMAMSVPAAGASARAVPAAPAPSPSAAAASADRLVASGRAPVHASPHDRIVRRGVVSGAGGLQFVSYERTYAGLPVQGGDFVVTTDASGTVLSTSAAQDAELTVATKPTITAAQAAAASAEQLLTVTSTSTPKLSVLAEGHGRLIYETVVTGTRRPPAAHNLKGPGGSYGVKGAGGSHGAKKPGGSYGVAGPGGSYGLKGPGGSYGLAGPSGSYGLAGPGGSYGLAGPPGSYGLAGPPGSYGFAGPPGSYGFAGPPGSYGVSGAKGPGGSYGLVAPPGSYGFAGPPGSYGFAGPGGSYGFAGPGGSYGLAGPPGSYGMAGPRGSYGVAKAAAQPAALHVFVDARTGKVVRSWNEVVDIDDDQSFYHGGSSEPTSIATTGSGGTFSLRDPGRPGISCSDMSGTVFTGTDDAWGKADGTDLETACVDAMKGAQAEYDMVKTWLGRNGLDGNGGGWPLRVGFNDANAYWAGSYAVFGRNEATTRQATPTDVVAHELGHGIFQSTPGGGNGSNEKGALNESTGDIFGALTEWYLHEPRVTEKFSGNVAVRNFDPPDYTVGEELDLLGKGPIRSMPDPASIGEAPGCFNSDVPVMEPHTAAGVQNHWFYLLAEGSEAGDPKHGRPDSPTCDKSTVKGVGIKKAGLIFMSTLNMKTSGWSHSAVRKTSLQAVRNLVQAKQASCADFNRTRDAWNAVSVPAASGEPTSCKG